MQTVDAEVCKLDGADAGIAGALHEKCRPRGLSLVRFARHIHQYAAAPWPDFVPLLQLVHGRIEPDARRREAVSGSGDSQETDVDDDLRNQPKVTGGYVDYRAGL